MPCWNCWVELWPEPWTGFLWPRMSGKKGRELTRGWVNGTEFASWKQKRAGAGLRGDTSLCQQWFHQWCLTACTWPTHGRTASVGAWLCQQSCCPSRALEVGIIGTKSLEIGINLVKRIFFKSICYFFIFQKAIAFFTLVTKLRFIYIGYWLLAFEMLFWKQEPLRLAEL